MDYYKNISVILGDRKITSYEVRVEEDNTVYFLFANCFSEENENRNDSFCVSRDVFPSLAKH